MQDWPNAEAAASAVIGDSQYKLPDDLTSVFLKNSTGAIWQLQQPRVFSAVVLVLRPLKIAVSGN